MESDVKNNTARLCPESVTEENLDTVKTEEKNDLVSHSLVNKIENNLETLSPENEIENDLKTTMKIEVINALKFDSLEGTSHPPENEEDATLMNLTIINKRGNNPETLSPENEIKNDLKTYCPKIEVTNALEFISAENEEDPTSMNLTIIKKELETHVNKIGNNLETLSPENEIENDLETTMKIEVIDALEFNSPEGPSHPSKNEKDATLMNLTIIKKEPETLGTEEDFGPLGIMDIKTENETHYNDVKPVVKKDATYIKQVIDVSMGENAYETKTIYTCTICSFETFFLGAIKTHLRRHNTIRKHPCKLCDFVGSTGLMLKQHRRTHKIHLCPICGFTTAYRPGLRVHMQLHDPKDLNEARKRYACDKCDFKSKHNYHLKKHLLTHEPEEVREKLARFSCEHCFYKTDRISDFKKHNKRVHIEKQKPRVWRRKIGSRLTEEKCNDDAKEKVKESRQSQQNRSKDKSAKGKSRLKRKTL